METGTFLRSAPLAKAEGVAALLKVSPQTVYRWAKDGLPPAFREGKLIRFLVTDVEAFVRDRVWVEKRGLA